MTLSRFAVGLLAASFSIFIGPALIHATDMTAQQITNSAGNLIPSVVDFQGKNISLGILKPSDLFKILYVQCDAYGCNANTFTMSTEITDGYYVLI